jgi:hypothetical protein
MPATAMRTWITGIALLAFGIGVHTTIGGNHLSTGAAAALIVIAGLLVARTLAGSAVLIVGGRPIGAPAYARTRRPTVVRQSDPDAPGRARPRAPGSFPLR